MTDPANADEIWRVCPLCQKWTPRYLRSCWKCGKEIPPATTNKPEQGSTPSPVPPPKQNPSQPTGCWACKKCGIKDNAAWQERCYKCGEAKTELQNPSEPAKSPSPQWKRYLKWALGLAGSAVTVLSIVAVFYAPLRPILAVVKAVLASLSGIFSGDFL